MNQRDIIYAIVRERVRQDHIHTTNEESEYPAILMEEVGEVGKALQGEGNLREELVQVAAVCVRWLERL